jgi:GT2 family glycosyltransferase
MAELSRAQRRARRRWYLFRREIWRSGLSSSSLARRIIVAVIPPIAVVVAVVDRVRPTTRVARTLAPLNDDARFPEGVTTTHIDEVAEIISLGAVSSQPRTDSPVVSIVIPTRDRLDLLRACLSSLHTTSYEHLEIVIADNDSVEPDTLAFFAASSHRIVPAPGDFNYARIVNTAVAQTSGEVIVTLNNDVVITDPTWLTRMLSYLHDDVGVVGCALVEPSGESQHLGIAIAPYPQHLRAGINIPADHPLVTTPRRVAAVTGACTAISRATWNAIGGLDENLRVVHNDVDMCLRAQARGFATVIATDVVLQHAESSSRGALTPPPDIFTFMAKWDILGSYRDPWFPAHWRIVGDQIHWCEA